jgi:hypothetical protein
MRVFKTKNHKNHHMHECIDATHQNGQKKAIVKPVKHQGYVKPVHDREGHESAGHEKHSSEDNHADDNHSDHADHCNHKPRYAFWNSGSPGSKMVLKVRVYGLLYKILIVGLYRCGFLVSDIEKLIRDMISRINSKEHGYVPLEDWKDSIHVICIIDIYRKNNIRLINEALYRELIHSLANQLKPRSFCRRVFIDYYTGMSIHVISEKFDMPQSEVEECIKCSNHSIKSYLNNIRNGDNYEKEFQ